MPLRDRSKIVIAFGAAANLLLFAIAWGGYSFLGIALAFWVATPWGLLLLSHHLSLGQGKDQGFIALLAVIYMLISCLAYIPATYPAGSGWSIIIFMLVPLVASPIAGVVCIAIAISRWRFRTPTSR